MTVAFDLGYEGKPCNTSLGTTDVDKLCYVKLSGQLTETDSRVGFGNQTWRIQEDAALAIASGDCELN